MPTLDIVEGYEHQVASVLQFGGAGAGIADNIVNAAGVSFVTGRNAGAAIRITLDGVTATTFRRDLPVSQSRVISKYFRLPVGAPAATATFHTLRDSAGNIMAQFQALANGSIQARAATGTFQQSQTGLDDGSWYRLDYWLDSTGTTWTLHWRVDGVAQTNASQGTHVATDSTQFTLGSGTATDALTIDFDDVIGSTGGNPDYPLGAHHVIGVLPNREGTDANPSNMPVTGGTTGWDVLRDWPADTSTFVAETAIGASDYREVGFDLIHSDEVVLGAQAYAALFAAGTTACTGDTRIVDKDGNTLATVYSGDMSETSLHYRAAIVSAPANGWDGIGFNQIKGRVGFSSDATPDPQWSALLVQVALDTGFPTNVEVDQVPSQPHLTRLAGSLKLAPILIAPIPQQTPEISSIMAAGTGQIRARGTASGVVDAPLPTPQTPMLRPGVRQPPSGPPLLVEQKSDVQAAAAVSASGSGRARLRGTATVAQVAAGLGRTRSYGTASSIRVAAGASRARLRGTAAAVRASAGASRARLRGTAAAVRAAAGASRGRLRGTATVTQVAAGASRARLRGLAERVVDARLPFPQMPLFRIGIKQPWAGPPVLLEQQSEIQPAPVANAAGQGRARVFGTASSIRVAAGASRARLRGTAAAVRAAAGASRARLRGTAAAIRAAAAIGQSRLRGTAAAVRAAAGAARARLFGSATRVLDAPLPAPQFPLLRLGLRKLGVGPPVLVEQISDIQPANVLSAAGQGRARLRGTASVTQVADGVGRARLRGTATAMVEADLPFPQFPLLRVGFHRAGVGPPVLLEQRSEIQAAVVVTASGSGRARLRGTASPTRTSAGVGRLRCRGTATSIRAAAGATRARARGTAAGVRCGTGLGRARLRGTASSRRVASGVGRLRGRGSGTGAKLAAAAGHGRARLFGLADVVHRIGAEFAGSGISADGEQQAVTSGASSAASGPE